MRHTAFLGIAMLVLTAGCGPSAAPPSEAPDLPAAIYDVDTDRPGNDIARSEMAVTGTAEECAAMCQANSECQAWSYLAVNVNGPNPFCILKDPAPERVPLPGVTSGLRQP